MVDSGSDRRKLMQIGFAALLARKQVVEKQYIYEDRTDGGFVFEPVLRNNQPLMADDEYMKKKYYSQVVYEGTMDGSIDTTIQEGDPNKRAARRLWAGRKGTGWGGTGKGGYMDSLQPGVPETKGTGLGSARVESDLLMQVYLEKQSNKMHILKAKSQQATQDLFKEIAKHAQKETGVIDSSAKEYIPPPKDQGASLKDFRTYVAPGYLPTGIESEHGGTAAQKKEWAEKAIRKLSSTNWQSLYTNINRSEFNVFTSYGFLQGAYAAKLLAMKPGSFLKPSDRRRLLDNNLGRQPAGGDRPIMGKEGMLKGVGGLYHDYDTMGAFSDREDTEHYGAQEGPRGGKGGLRSGPSRNEGSDFTGDGGAISVNNMEIADAKLLRTTFKKERIDQLFPKSWQEFKRLERKKLNELMIARGQLLNQDLDIPIVEVSSAAEAEKFIRWMQKELNDEQQRLNEIIPQFDEHGYREWKKKGTWPSKSGLDLGGDYSKGGGIDAIREHGTQRYLAAIEGTGRGGISDYRSEIARGFMKDFGLLNDEAKYLMSNRFGLKKDKKTGTQEWKYLNQSAQDRGVDLYLPQEGGLLKIHISARVVPGTAKSRPYVKLDIPHKSKWNKFRGGITFIPDVAISLQEMEIREMKGKEHLESFNELTQQYWQKGADAQFKGAAMLTQSGYSTRMFMGDMSPAQSVGFFTSTISARDFADHLKTLVDVGAEYWWSDRTGFDRYFNLEEMEGGAFKTWALKWAAESKRLEDNLNKAIEMKWQMWLENYAGGGATAPAPRIANTWEGPLRIGPFVHSTKYLGQAQSIGRRKHGYYVHGDWGGGPLA